MRAKKSYGQHFLHREDIAEKISNSLIHTHLYNKVIEIGPGQGMMTKYLMETWGDNLIAVEADRDMVAYLAEHYPTLNVTQHDFLKIWLNRVFEEGEQFALIGNYPYNISSQIVFRMLEHREVIPELVGMFQKEMAERIIAPPGGKVYGVISVLTQAFYHGEYLFTVDPDSFNPPPRVMSGVIRLTRKDDNELGCDHQLFRRVVKQAFSQRRKMLRNTMKIFIPHDELMKDDFFRVRPETLSLEQFVALTNKVEGWIEKEEKED
jgi:16S rRNA (adenine1518-N6/adenine1519-N6)-dimethyltransferase